MAVRNTQPPKIRRREDYAEVLWDFDRYLEVTLARGGLNTDGAKALETARERLHQLVQEQAA